MSIRAVTSRLLQRGRGATGFLHAVLGRLLSSTPRESTPVEISIDRETVRLLMPRAAVEINIDRDTIEVTLP